MIELVSISKTFNAGKPGRFRALEHIDLRLANGQVTVFTGPSGSDKTTMLSSIISNCHTITTCCSSTSTNCY